MKDLKILITDKFYTDLLSEYHLKYTLTHSPDITTEELLDAIHEVNVLIISTRIPITEKILTHAHNLKIIIRMGSGVDHINLLECKKRNIIVCNTPFSNVQSVSEYVFGQILSYYRHFELLNTNVLNGVFKEGIPLGRQLNSKKIGIIGVGRIGSNIANIAKCFGMHILGCDPYLNDAQKLAVPIDKWVTTTELLQNSDIVTLHVPLTDETNYMVNTDFLDLMKKDSILINSSRGKVVKLDDVIAYTEKGKIQQFIIDVFENEPFTPELDPSIHPYFRFSPHAAAYTEDSMYNRSKEALIQVDEFVENKKPHGYIDYDRGY